MTNRLNPADVQAGVQSAIRAWLDANGADIAELIARTVAEATVKNTAPHPDAARVEKVAQSVYVQLTQRGALTENGVKMTLTVGKRPFVRDALRYLEDQGRAEYDGTRWHAKPALPATYPFAVSAPKPVPVTVPTAVVPPKPATAAPVLSAPEVQDAVRESAAQRSVVAAKREKYDLEMEVIGAVRNAPNATVSAIVAAMDYEHTHEGLQVVLNDLVRRNRIAAVQEGSAVRYHPAPSRSTVPSHRRAAAIARLATDTGKDT